VGAGVIFLDGRFLRGESAVILLNCVLGAAPEAACDRFIMFHLLFQPVCPGLNHFDLERDTRQFLRGKVGDLPE
jgi:hypothetical protein